MNDITPELLNKIKQEFDNIVQNNKKIRELENILENKLSDYSKAGDYAIELGNALSETFKKTLSSDVLPNGKMYYNIANEIINDRLKENFNLISNYATTTQTILNHQSNLKIKRH